MDTTVCDKEYKLPTGEVILIGRERFAASEILFNPMLIDHEEDGMHEMIYNAIRACPLDF